VWAGHLNSQAPQSRTGDDCVAAIPPRGHPQPSALAAEGWAPDEAWGPEEQYEEDNDPHADWDADIPGDADEPEDTQEHPEETNEESEETQEESVEMPEYPLPGVPEYSSTHLKRPLGVDAEAASEHDDRYPKRRKMTRGKFLTRFVCPGAGAPQWQLTNPPDRSPCARRGPRPHHSGGPTHSDKCSEHPGHRTYSRFSSPAPDPCSSSLSQFESSSMLRMNPPKPNVQQRTSKAATKAGIVKLQLPRTGPSQVSVRRLCMLCALRSPAQIQSLSPRRPKRPLHHPAHPTLAPVLSRHMIPNATRMSISPAFKTRRLKRYLPSNSRAASIACGWPPVTLSQIPRP
jgi:hypothetical protein